MNMTSKSSDQVGKKRKSPIAKAKRQQHDIGYSSEGYSNEELDDRKLESRRGAFGSPTCENVFDVAIPLRAASKAPTAQSAWRHSMTSAYETASNGSDPNLLENDGTSPGVDRTKTTSPEFEPHDSGFGSANCPSTGDEYSMSRSHSANQNYLYLTNIEGDSSSSVDPQSSSQSYPYDRCESGNTSEMGSMDIPLDDIPEERYEGSPGSDVSSSRQRLFGRNEDHRRGKHYMEESFSLEEPEGNLSSAAKQVKDMYGSRDERGDSLSVYFNSGASSRAAAFSDEELAAIADTDRDTISQLKAPNLVKQIDLMIREGKLNKLTNHKWPKYLESPSEWDMKAGFKARANDSFTSTDGSTRAGRRRFSSCDASDESGSEISVSGINHDGKHMLDLSPFSISESAIDDHDTRRRQNRLANQNLRRTASEQQSPNKYLQRSGGDVSAKKRRRRLRHSLSEEARTPAKRLSPGGSRNRLHLTSSGRGNGKVQRRSASPVLEGHMRNRVKGAHRALEYSYSDSDIDIATLPVCTSSAAEDPQTATTAPSAVEFSEEGWDNYQMPPQDVLSDASEEQKLDASYLQREWDINSQSGDCLSYGQPKRPSKSKGAVVLDSDSDFEDFQSVIVDSTKALVFTESVLTKRRKDDMETGISLEPSEYKESLATCETNVKCLDDVVKTLQGEVGINNVTGEDIDHVQDMICKWESMETLAIERLQQSQQLKGVFEDMKQMQIALDEVDSIVSKNNFSQLMDMEASIFAVKQRRDSLSKHRDKLQAIGIKIQAFENNNDHINMNKFMKEVDNLDAYVEELSLRSEQKATDLENALLAWYDLKEKTGELEHSINREVHQVRALEVAHECLKQGQCTSQQILGARADLSTLEGEFKPLSSQLHMLRALRADVAPFLARDTELQLRTQVGMQESALNDLKVRHETLLLKVEQAAAPRLQRQSSTESLAPRVDERTFLMRLLRAALPFSMVLLAVLVLVYLLDPELFDNAGIVISPQLKYVRGAPPT